MLSNQSASIFSSNPLTYLSNQSIKHLLNFVNQRNTLTTLSDGMSEK
jgi:hypothetical protein